MEKTLEVTVPPKTESIQFYFPGDGQILQLPVQEMREVLTKYVKEKVNPNDEYFEMTLPPLQFNKQ